jgi:hypothetical protein
MSGIRMEKHTSQGVPSGSAASNLMAAEMHHRSALMKEEGRVKFTLFITWKHIDQVRTPGAHILCDTPHLIMIGSLSPKSIPKHGLLGHADTYEPAYRNMSVWSINQLSLWFRLIRVLGQMRHPTCRRCNTVHGNRDGSEFTHWTPTSGLGFQNIHTVVKRAKPSHVGIYKTLESKKAVSASPRLVGWQSVTSIRSQDGGM